MPLAPLLLALDTATSLCSVALVTRDGQVDARVRDVGQRHSEHLLSMIDDLLAARALSLGALDAIGFGAGPGSFTGLRIACGVAQGLAYGIDRPLIPIGNLAALALDAFERAAHLEVVLTAQDARMGEVYWAAYRRTDPAPRLVELAPAALAAPGDLIALATRHGAQAIVGNVWQSFAETLSAFGGARVDGAVGGAAAIARLAVEVFVDGGAVAAGEGRPIYVRDRVALTVEERRAHGRPSKPGPMQAQR
jgi:tRNA threonylcarbamoyladenosine biosynthesis protein TsaB